jgi:hypothetical protein
MCSALGSAAVVSMLVLCAAGLGPRSELVIDGAKNLVDDQAGKGWGKRISLREAILLYEEVKGTIGSVEKALVWVLVHKVEIVNEGMEARVGFEDVQGFFTGHLIPAVDEINKNAGAVRGLVGSQRLGDEDIQLGVC